MSRAGHGTIEDVLTSAFPHERRIVRRLRLLDELEAATTPTILLVAPAGYGKTTLAQQWIDRAGGTRLTITPGARDIPVLARDLAAALAEIVPIDLRRVETALGAARTPLDQARSVARTILGQVSAPLESWLVIDDYQLLMPNRAAEEFIGQLEGSGRFKLMIASRERPSWATSRRFVHLEILELGPPDLALDDEETAELLPATRHSTALREHARGWPAVIALAARSRSADMPLTADTLAESLYDYFAEELFEQATPAVQRLLTRIALLPPLNPDELSAYLSEPTAVTQVLSTGLVQRREGVIEVHPLARAFLLTKVRDEGDLLEMTRASIELCLSKRLWDEAFGLIREFQLNDYLETLITSAFTLLMEKGRLATLESLQRHATVHGGVSQPLLDLIQAEIALRDGVLQQALALAKGAAGRLPAGHPLEARCYIVAGKAAHLTHQLEEAFDLYNTASTLAERAADLNDATWGKCSAALFLESERAQESVHDLECVAAPRPEDRMRLFTARQHQAYLGESRNGRLQADERIANYLLTTISDPWVRTAWGNTQGYSLMLAARYQEAHEVLSETLKELIDFRLWFGRAQVDWSLAAAELGLRHFARCDALLRRVERGHSGDADLHLQLNVRALRARLCLVQQRPGDALALTADNYERYPTRAMYGEYLSTRALALAITGNRSQAVQTADRASCLTHGVDTQVLCAAVTAIVALSESPTADEAAEALLDTAARLGSWDGVVCASRSSLELATRLATVAHHKQEFRDVLFRANDAALAKAVGLGERGSWSRGVLSSREAEILDLVSNGLTNKEIASALFIEASTVKAHVTHILDKLGARSRAEAVARYMEMAVTSESGS